MLPWQEPLGELRDLRFISTSGFFFSQKLKSLKCVSKKESFSGTQVTLGVFPEKPNLTSVSGTILSKKNQKPNYSANKAYCFVHAARSVALMEKIKKRIKSTEIALSVPGLEINHEAPHGSRLKI